MLSPESQLHRKGNPALLDRLEPRAIVLADKTYDAGGIRDLIEAQGTVPNILAKANRKWKPCFSRSSIASAIRSSGSSVSSNTSAASPPATTSSPTTSSLWPSSPQCACGRGLMSLWLSQDHRAMVPPLANVERVIS